MDRSNHYEAAFEAYLQWHGLCHVGVDETRRAFMGDEAVKNLDFIVLGPARSRLLVDVKGRRFPGGPPGRERHVWECWSTQDDVTGLERWVEMFGPGYQGLLVFMYQLQASVGVPDDTADLWTWRGSRYLLRAVRIDSYRRHMRRRSPRWGTVGLPQAVFRRLVRPFSWYAFPFAEGCRAPLEDRCLCEIAPLASSRCLGGDSPAGFGGA
jgi:hypothetical protein